MRGPGSLWLIALLAVATPAGAGPSGASAGNRIVPWGGALPEPKVEPYRGPYKATLGCAEGLKNFPFLKPWVARLDNFVAPVEIGSTEGSLFYALGVASVSKNAPELWMKDSYVAPVDWKEKGGTIETAWLGERPGTGPAIKPGPGFAAVKGVGKGESWSQMTTRHDTAIAKSDPALQGYAANAIAEAGKIGSWARFWALLLSPQELELLDECTTAECLIKFNGNELKAVTGSSHQYRVAQFRRLIESRMDEFQKQGRIWAYEGTYKPLDWEDLPISREFPAKYETHFWQPIDRKFFGYDLLDAEPGHHKPVLGLFTRQCEKRGMGTGQFTACTDIVLYNNHYFDFWARVVFFFPWCDVQVAMAYETMDIDQIKESRVVRILFGGEMRKLMGMLLETRLKHLHMLGI